MKVWSRASGRRSRRSVEVDVLRVFKTGLSKLVFISTEKWSDGAIYHLWRLTKRDSQTVFQGIVTHSVNCLCVTYPTVTRYLARHPIGTTHGTETGITLHNDKVIQERRGKAETLHQKVYV